MQTFQSASPRRVFVELTASRTNALQFSFLKRRRTSNSSAETFSQEEFSYEKQMKRVKEGDVDIQCLDTKLIPYHGIDTSPIHTSHEEKIKNLESNTFSKDGCADVRVDCVSKNEKYNALQGSDSNTLPANSRLLESFFLSKEQIKKYAHVLKLRLRLAYYKLQINQPHSAFSTLLLIPKRDKISPVELPKTTLSKTVVPDIRLLSPIGSQPYETASQCLYNNDNLILNTFNYCRYNIGLSSPPLSEERYCKDGFPLDFTENMSK
ncbi:hypothetical protein PNEG_01251 [Pneumocystis murina B123]|uniref:Uncharacterized protein n=1 Tax=Pneumocystis murina (strain B123) TaxID=1069680 RepID=M7PJA9_PNEMU|nr:hypothetical protein PNEG_01251 [Pneumocystis murina B123]EMR10544.1 hypothetical protein PNEG_01251 [Pneumocystis murina B123]